jgi:ATP synthase protein I
MPENSEDTENKDPAFAAAVETREKRKIRALQKKDKSHWFGLGMFGVVGWSVALPVVGAVFLGIWVDQKWPGPYSWTLMLLVLGLTAGCLNAWTWISRERKSIKNERENNGD